MEPDINFGMDRVMAEIAERTEREFVASLTPEQLVAYDAHESGKARFIEAVQRVLSGNAEARHFYRLDGSQGINSDVAYFKRLRTEFTLNRKSYFSRAATSER